MTLEVKRGKNKNVMDYFASDIYEFWRQRGGAGVKSQDFKKICFDINVGILNEIIFNNYAFKMPRKLGELAIVLIKNDFKRTDTGRLKLKVDWKRTQDHWIKEYGVTTLEECKRIPNKKLFYHLNEHSGGRYIQWWWRKGAVKNIVAYSIDVSRAAKRCAAKFVKSQDDQPYYSMTRREFKDIKVKDNKDNYEV